MAPRWAIVCVVLGVLLATVAAESGFPAKCSACHAVAAQLRARLESEAPRSHVDARHRLDKDGKKYGKLIKYELSELRMIELLDDLCEGLPNYELAAVNETAGTPESWVQRAGGKASTDIKRKAQQKQLANFCADLIERHEDKLARALREGETQPEGLEELLCLRISSHCAGAGSSGGGGRAERSNEL